METALRPIVKSYAGTLRQDGSGRVLRRECWVATTADGEWAFERVEEPGTPWTVVRRPRTADAETATCWFGTLKAARQAVERGVERWLPSHQLVAHNAGEHAGEHAVSAPYGCHACDEIRWNR